MLGARTIIGACSRSIDSLRHREKRHGHNLFFAGAGLSGHEERNRGKLIEVTFMSLDGAMDAADIVQEAKPYFFPARLSWRPWRNCDHRSRTGRHTGGTANYNDQRAGHAMDVTPVPAPVAKLAAKWGTDAPTYALDRPGLSAFVLEDGVVYYACPTFVRGLDGLGACTSGFDRSPKGPNETDAGAWFRPYAEYKG